MLAGYYDVDKALILAAESVRCFGYHKTFESTPTKYIVSKILEGAVDDKLQEYLDVNGFNVFNSDSMFVADNAREFILNTNNSNPESYEYKLRNICIQGECSKRDLGLLVSLISYFQRIINREKKEYERQQAGQYSEFQGTVGNKLNFYIKSMTLNGGFESVFGYCYIYKMSDNNDNIYTWLTNRGDINCNAWVGKKLDAFVKSHNEYKGVKETVLTRCKII